MPNGCVYVHNVLTLTARERLSRPKCLPVDVVPSGVSPGGSYFSAPATMPLMKNFCRKR